MTPVACMPAAALLLRLGALDVLNIFWMEKAGAAIIDNLPMIFAIGIAIGLAKENNGVAGLAAAVGQFTITNVAISFDETTNMGVLAGYVWPVIQTGLNTFGNEMIGLGAIGAGIFGLLNRLLIPFGLHHVFNTLFWFEFGTFTNSAGEVVKGDIARFFAGDPTAGTYMTGFYFIMMFALPADCFAMLLAAKKSKRKAVTGMLLSIAFTAFLTGITEPVEFAFMFLAPALYVFHAIMTGIALALANVLNLAMGFGFSAGLIDFLLSMGISRGVLTIVIVGLIFAAIYFAVFYFAITKFNLPTPGREDDEILEDEGQRGTSKTNIDDKAEKILEALGGPKNIESLDACITRIRLTLNDSTVMDEEELKKLGASGIMKLDSKNVQVIVGTLADPIVSSMKKIMK